MPTAFVVRERVPSFRFEFLGNLVRETVRLRRARVPECARYCAVPNGLPHLRLTGCDLRRLARRHRRRRPRAALREEHELLVALAEDSGLGDPDPYFAAERGITVSTIAVTPVPAETAG